MASPKRRRKLASRKRVGRVSYYLHHGSWHVYYRDGARQIRRRVSDDPDEAERVAAQINAQLAAQSPTLLAFTPISVADLRQRFLDHHEQVLRSSLATIRRYRAATQHLENYVREHEPKRDSHELQPHRFVAYLRDLMVAPNGHPHTQRRPLRDKGIRYILECCRSMYSFAQRMRHLPPYASNPFVDLRLDQLRNDNAKPVFVFDAEAELAFLKAADDWSFACHFTLAKTGMRPGELVHLLIEEVDLDAGWLRVRGKPLLGWRVKTGRDRDIPLVSELIAVLRRVIGDRQQGLVFVRPRFGVKGQQLNALNLAQLHREFEHRTETQSKDIGRALNRIEQSQIARRVWHENGIAKVDAIRSSFIRIMNSIGFSDATCPKSWRHSFATLLQDAGVDPLIRQVSLGHKPAGSSAALGMTSIYTHTRPETHRNEIVRALQLWPKSLHIAQQWAKGSA